MTEFFRKLFGAKTGGNLRAEIDADGIMHSQVSDEDLISEMEIFEDEGEQPTAKVRSCADEVKWAQSDNYSPDYAHLQTHGATEMPFVLRAQDLEFLAKLNDFPIDRNGNTPILFGLRGCKIVKSSSSPETEVELLDVRPTHHRPRCVLGVWDHANGLVSAFPGSTVPDPYGVCNHYSTGGGGNILPPGYYGYIVGSHSGRPGCFLLRYENGNKRKVIVRRTGNNLWYELEDKIDSCAPGDNIHPSFRNHANSFSSWGCQTVVGSANSGGNHSGPWAKFRIAAGMTDDTGNPGQVFDYMLLTGLEAMRASKARIEGKLEDPVVQMSLRRLRYGSTGEAVSRLQRALGLDNPDGVLGPNTCRALYVKQRASWGGDSDGIYSPTFDAEIGGGVFERNFTVVSEGGASSGTSGGALATGATGDRMEKLGMSSQEEDIIDLSEFLGDTVEEEDDIRDLPLTTDYKSLGIDADSAPERDGVKLWYPEADSSLLMPTRGSYSDGYPVGAVVHFTAGRCDNGDPHAEACVKYGAGQGYCYFCISRTGKIYQTAPLSRWGSHAGKSYYPALGSSLSRKLVGIEICDAGLVKKKDNGYEPWWNKPGSSHNNYYTDEEVRYVEKVENITDRGFYQKYTPEQEEALIQLLRWLRENNPGVFKFDHVLGHDEIAPKRKNDPGGAMSMTMPKLRAKLVQTPVAALAPGDTDPAGSKKFDRTLFQGDPWPEYQAGKGRSRSSPVHLEDENFSYQSALFLAEASKLSYDESDEIKKQVCGEWGCDNYQFISVENTQCFIASNDKVCFVAFRGTDNTLADWWENFHISPTDCSASSSNSGQYGMVHQGFCDAFTRVKGDVESVLKAAQSEGKKIWLTGHSLGAALATIAAADLKPEIAISGVHTFGQPLTGDEGLYQFFANNYPDNFYRFVNKKDPVTEFPGSLLQSVNPYMHVEKLVQLRASPDRDELGENGEAVASPPPPLTEAEFEEFKDQIKKLRELQAERGDLSRDELSDLGIRGPALNAKDHSIRSYIEAIGELAGSGSLS